MLVGFWDLVVVVEAKQQPRECLLHHSFSDTALKIQPLKFLQAQWNLVAFVSMCGRGLCRGAAGNPRVPRLLPGTLGSFPGCL